MEITLTPQARTHAPAKPWTAAAYMIKTVELPKGTIDTMDTRIAILTPRNLKALNEASLAGKSKLDLEAPASAPTRVGVETFLETSDFSQYVEMPTPSTAVASAVRTAVAGDADDGEIAKIAARNPGDHAKDQERKVLAKRMERVIRHGGKDYAAGHWVVKTDEGIEVVADAEFGGRFKNVEAGRTPKKAKSEFPPA